MSDSTFRGRVVVVTGGERGIGRGIVLAFASRGAHLVVAHADDERSADEAADVAAQVRHAGSDVLLVRTDVRSESDVASLARAAESSFGRIDVLVNNAGVYPRALVTEMPVETFDDTVAVNLRGTFLCCRAVLPGMIARRGGRIVTISSAAAFAPRVRGAHYAATKAGIIGLSRALALEVAPHGITVNVVAPGTVDTEQSRQELDDEAFAQLARDIPIGRIGTPGDVAGAVLYFASDAASWVTGQTLLVNGGRLMR